MNIFLWLSSRQGNRNITHLLGWSNIQCFGNRQGRRRWQSNKHEAAGKNSLDGSTIVNLVNASPSCRKFYCTVGLTVLEWGFALLYRQAARGAVTFNQIIKTWRHDASTAHFNTKQAEKVAYLDNIMLRRRQVLRYSMQHRIPGRLKKKRKRSKC